MLKRKSWSPSVFKLDFPHQSNTFLVADVLVAQFDGWPCLYPTILTAKWAKWGWDSMFEFLVVHGVVTRPCLHNNHWTTNSRTRWFAVLGPWQRGKWGRLSCTMKAQFHMAKSLSSLPTYIWRLDRLHCRCFLTIRLFSTKLHPRTRETSRSTRATKRGTCLGWECRHGA